MEHEGCEKVKQTSIQFCCKKILAGVNTDKLNTAEMQIGKCDEKQDSGKDFESPTPEKPEWKTKAKSVGFPIRKQLADCFEHDRVILQSTIGDHGKSVAEDSPISEYSEQRSKLLCRSPDACSNELPDKYMILGGLFNRMESSIRLLNLRKRLPTFQNICTQVEVLTKRKLLCSHLSQMKYIFPEAILIEKILIHDEKTLCMKPDMKITLLLDVVTCQPEQSASMALCQAFHSKLLGFYNNHPEVPDIPEAMLPEPFSQRNQTDLQNPLCNESLLEALQRSSDSLDNSISHLPLSFRKQFSQRTFIPETEKTQLLATPSSISTSANHEGMEISDSYQKAISSAFTLKPPEVICTPNRSTISHLPEITPAKYVINSGDLTTQTPALETPKRPMPTPTEKVIVEDEQLAAEVKLSHSARRSLMYSPSKHEGTLSDPIICMSERNKAIQSTFNQTILGSDIPGEDVHASATTKMIGNTSSVNEDSNLCKMGVGQRQEILASLLDIFDTICRISRSINCSHVTKEELLHKIISDNLDIEDTSEVEEQLQLLEEFAPDWICKRVVSGGDIIYSIKQRSDLQSVREKLVEAV